MGNKIVNIGTDYDNVKKNEVFIDLCMDSGYRQYKNEVDIKSSKLAKEQTKILLDAEETEINIAIDNRLKNSLYTDYSGYKISKNVNVKAVQQSIHNIFTWIPGERIINPEFGSLLRKYLYEGILKQTEELIVAEIKSCMMKWEPRAKIVDIVNVGNVNDTEDNTMHLEIIYTIPDLSDEQYSYSYYYNKTE